mmetsp:Transcript_11752/g.38729  ORF Transcript_11752/g.38729 Transcript_11752/m.38729 type:complete len:212 (+) Transcript_11752:442-1077(+)
MPHSLSPSHAATTASFTPLPRKSPRVGTPNPCSLTVLLFSPTVAPAAGGSAACGHAAAASLPSPHRSADTDTTALWCGALRVALARSKSITSADPSVRATLLAPSAAAYRPTAPVPDPSSTTGSPSSAGRESRSQRHRAAAAGHTRPPSTGARAAASEPGGGHSRTSRTAPLGSGGSVTGAKPSAPPECVKKGLAALRMRGDGPAREAVGL